MTAPESLARTAARHLATLCPHSGQGRADGEPLLPPIVQSTTFCRDGIDSAAAHRYSRESNPTVAALEIALGDLETAPPALCFATGLAAETALVLATVGAGRNVVCSRAVYGGTTRLLRDVLAKFGVGARFVDTTDLAAVEAAIDADTALVFVETPANPTLDVSDLAAIARLAHRRGALVAVDNTFLTPVFQQPLDLGCDVSVYSTTKFVDGHSAALGGALVTRDAALRERIAFVRKCTGAIQSPHNAWLTLQGLKTLALRLPRQTESAARIARWLDEARGVATVHYPTLPRFRQRALAARQHRGGHGAVVSFELEGGLDAARAFVRHVRIPRLVEHVGSVETLLTHSATMTHGSVPRADREAVGVTDGLLRLSVGIEDCDDLLQDLCRALDAVRNGTPDRAEAACRAN